ncbi:hypothetical protein SASPL_149330 [Salvia splendens]|uniref:Protein kinase domain-containing protein n=1 Tax=Salvia splendens TaxID=180675 RepID=A0A8X8Z547_SALSN|nr:hypothetical protein SASPL_149330 [Salvia splendens]
MLKCTFMLIVLVLHLLPCCDAKCTPSSCGTIPNISRPFRLNSDPINCSDPRFELRCENNVTYISLNSQNYYVKAINYHNSTIRLVDASIVNDDICSFPIVSSDAFSFIYDNPHPIPYRIPTTPNPINFISCPYPLNSSSLFTDVTSHCASSSSSLLSTYAFIKVGHLNASELPHLCTLDLIVMTSWQGFKRLDNVSLSEIHQSLLYGFELVVCPSCKITPRKFFVSFFYDIIPVLLIIVGLLCAMVSPSVFTIFGFAAVSLLLFYTPVLYSTVIDPIKSQPYYYHLPEGGSHTYLPLGKNAISLTTARGTIGYVAPELINRSMGAVSYKADVYSFGMMLIDIVGLKRDLRGKNDHSSQYFPYWIYDCFDQGKDIEIEGAEYDDENESRKSIVKKMTIVALWCILMSPDDRPSMNKVLEMLEGDVERLQIPSQSTQIGITPNLHVLLILFLCFNMWMLLSRLRACLTTIMGL